MADLRMGGAEYAGPVAPEELQALTRNVDHYAPVFLGYRVEVFRLMHAQGEPVRHSENYGGYWFVTGHSQVTEAQRRTSDFSNSQKVVPLREMPQLIPSGLDGSRHKSVKMALAKLFLPAAIATLKQNLAEIAGALFDECVEAGTFDVVQDLMFPLMARFTMEYVLGLDPAKARAYAAPIHNMGRRDYPPEKVAQELAELDLEFRDIIAQKRYAPDSILARIAALEIDGAPFTVEEMVKVAFNLLIGGFGTTATFVGSIFVFLGRNQDLRRQIIEDPAIIPSAIDEMLRLFPPVQTFARKVVADTELGGVTMQAGDQLLMGYGAANYDPNVFTNPEQVDFRRVPNPIMSFGVGPHRCLGESVARAVIREVLALAVSRCPDYELIEEGVAAQSFTASMFGYSNVKIRCQAQAVSL